MVGHPNVPGYTRRCVDIAAADDDVERGAVQVGVFRPDVQLVLPREHGPDSSAAVAIERHTLPLQRKKRNQTRCELYHSEAGQTCGPVSVASSG